MRHLTLIGTIFTLGILTACGSADNQNPSEVVVDEVPVSPPFVDGLYAVNITDFTDSCDGLDGTHYADAFSTVDILQHPLNNSFELRTDSYVVPNRISFTLSPEGALENVVPEADTDSLLGAMTLTGNVSKSGFDLRMTQNWTSDTAGACSRKARLVGTPRPITDSTTTDGLYDLLIDKGAPLACPMSEAIVDKLPGRMEVATLPLGSSLFTLAFNDHPFTATIAADGTVSGEQPVTEQVSHGQYVTFTQKVTGTMAAPAEKITVTETAVNTAGVTCGLRSSMEANKRIPERAKPDNDYRVQYDITGDKNCGLPADLAPSFMDVAIIGTSQYGVLVLSDFHSPKGLYIVLDQDNSFSTLVEVAQNNGHDLSYHGTVSNGEINYTVTSHYPAKDGRPECTATATGAGLIRFIP